jgi:hypothetical protein
VKYIRSQLQPNKFAANKLEGISEVRPKTDSINQQDDQGLVRERRDSDHEFEIQLRSSVLEILDPLEIIGPSSSFGSHTHRQKLGYLVCM